MAELAPMIDVTDVRVLGRYVVELGFADRTVRVIDLEPLLWGEMFEPVRADYAPFARSPWIRTPERSSGRTALICLRGAPLP